MDMASKGFYRQNTAEGEREEKAGQRQKSKPLSAEIVLHAAQLKCLHVDVYVLTGFSFV